MNPILLLAHAAGLGRVDPRIQQLGDRDHQQTLHLIRRQHQVIDAAFDEADHGFRGFGELLRHLESEHVVELRTGSAQGDPEVTFPENESADGEAFRLLVDVVNQLQAPGSHPQLSGLKDQLRKRLPDFSEKRYGFNTFLSFAKAARARNLIAMEWDEDTGDYLLHLP